MRSKGMEYTLKLFHIANSYGLENQLEKTIEELAELIVAIKKDDRDNIAEEIADVEILLDQLVYLFTKEDSDFINEFVAIKQRKVERQMKRLEEVEEGMKTSLEDCVAEREVEL